MAQTALTETVTPRRYAEDMGRTERIMLLESSLRTGDMILDAPEWSHKLGVDLRTFQRDLRFLRRVRRLPVYYDPKAGGYRMRGAARESGVEPGQLPSPASILLQLTSLLRSRPGLGAEELAKLLGCSVRSFHRHRATLQALGIPIVHGQGYSIVGRVSLGYLLLECEEFLALYLGALLVSDQCTETLGHCATVGFGKLAAATQRRGDTSPSQTSSLYQDAELDRPTKSQAIRDGKVQSKRWSQPSRP